MFEKNIITAFPTDTSWGLGVRADDVAGLQNLSRLKKRKPKQMFSLMVRDMNMLYEYADVPDNFPKDFFTEKPRTAILKPTEKMPKSEFWPATSVAFRVTTIPEVAAEIEYPVTATSANITGNPSIFSAEEIRNMFGKQVLVFPGFTNLPQQDASEIWDFTQESPTKIR